MIPGILDWICIGVLLVLALRGVIRGFSAEFFSFVSFTLAFLAAFFSSGIMARQLEIYLELKYSPWNQVMIFLFIFIIVYLLVKLIDNLIQDFLEASSFLDRFDRFLGFFLGLAEGLVLSAVIIFLISIQPFFELDYLLINSFAAALLVPFFKELPVHV